MAETFVTEITRQSTDFSRWYLDVVRKAELADYSPVKGCMVIRPYGYAIWERMQRELDDRLKATGHVNAYFPLFIPESLLLREAKHVEGFAPQVAWVTKGGTEELEEKLIVRPTSETIFGVMYQKLDPILARPSRAHQSMGQRRALGKSDASVPAHDRVLLAGGAYRSRDGRRRRKRRRSRSSISMLSSARPCLAMPVVKGQKSESEKFAGAVKTYSIEALMGDGRALQSGTSHNLGQNFAKAFEIQFQGRDKTLQHAWTTSWGVSTRLVGGLIMTHGDDSGLILPPNVAPWQVVIVPIPRGNWKETVLPTCESIRGQLQAAGIRVRLDADESQTPGWKFAEYEMRGVPLRLEIGPKDIEKNAVFAARRDTRQKQSLPMDGLPNRIRDLLAEIQASLLAKALAFREDHTSRTSSYDEFKEILEGRPGFVIAPWCESPQCEADIKAETQATIRNIPFDEGSPTEPCIKCGKPATVYAWFAKAY